MQTLGLSPSTPRTESRLKSLFWPTIANEGDVDYLTQQGFWICFIIAAITLPIGLLSGNPLATVFEAIFFFLAGIGIRQRSRAAAVSAFTAYLLVSMVIQKYTGNGFGIVRIIFLAMLLANIRGMWLSAQWPKSETGPELPRLNQTIGDKLSDSMPTFLWPKVKLIFYLFAALELIWLLYALFAPVVRAI
jgi:hypothetical protein